MEAKFKLVEFTDEWTIPSATLLDKIIRWPWPARWILSPLPRKPSEYSNYALGFQFVPSDRDIRLIRKHNLFSHYAVQVHGTDAPLTLADVLGPEFVPEVNPSFRVLLRVEALVREAAAIWSHQLDSMPDPK
jgi:hypothetical protein